MVYRVKKLTSYLSLSGLTAFILAVVLVFTGAGAAFAVDLPDEFKYENQWYAADNFLDYAGTMQLIQSQAVTLKRDKYKDEPIIIAVIDTGIDLTHPVFEGLIYTNTAEIAGNGKDDDNNGYKDDVNGWNFVNNNSNVSDVVTNNYGHGTHVAGIIAQAIRAYGLADYIKILPLKVGRDSGSSAAFPLDDTIEAINYAVKMGANVLNMSFGAQGNAYPEWKGDVIKKAVDDAYNAGVIMVAAAGNFGRNSSYDGFYPAAFSNVYGIMAYDETGKIAQFSGSGASNYGDAYQIIAPGYNIYSTVPKSSYGTKNGTSMASPMVSAMVAVLLLKYDAAATVVREVLDAYSSPSVSYENYSFKMASLKNMLSYVPVESFSAAATSQWTSQILGSVSPFTATANIYARYNNQGEPELLPETADSYGNVRWTVSLNGQTVATRSGKNLTYLPTEAGDYTVVAYVDKSGWTSDEMRFSIEYLDISLAKPIVNGKGGRLKLGKSAVFTISGYENVNPNKRPVINWYVNGVLDTSQSGDTFVFKPTDAGKYQIECRVANGQVLAAYTIRAAHLALWQVWSIVAAVLIVGLSAAGIISLVSLKRNKLRSQGKKNSRDSIEECGGSVKSDNVGDNNSDNNSDSGN